MIDDPRTQIRPIRSLLSRRLAISGVAAGAIVAVAALAVPAVASASATAVKVGTGSITGLVTGHGHPVQDICVRAINVRDHVSYKADTSSTGHYSIHKVTPGRYYVQFQICPSATSNWLFQWYKGVTSSNNGIAKPPPGVTTVPVKAGKTTAGINAAMKLGASISGRVTSAATGVGLHRICVIATATSPTFVDIIKYTAKGSNGAYALHALFPGRYQLEFGCGNNGSGYNFAPQWWKDSSTAAQATPIKISGTENARNIDAKLTPGAIITGTVRSTNASGAPLDGVCVNAGNGAGDGDSTVTAADGSYRLAGLATGKYTVMFDPDCGGGNSFNGENITVQATAGTTTSGIDAFLQPTS